MNDQFDTEERTRIALQHFTEKLNREPDPREFEKTPDNRASYLPISFLEMTLDEIFLGQWELTDVSYSQIFNEVVGTGILTVVNPITGRSIRRAGFGAVVITQDKDAAIVDFNTTKKKNALDLTFPKLKAEILKNAASSLGKVFGRDINRKQKDVFKPALKQIPSEALKVAIERAEKGDMTILPLAEASFLLTDVEKELIRNAGTKQLTNG
jgi:hypothetical protein